MRFLDLFSGIGGFSLGLERAGHTTVAFCEIDPYCRRVLKRHWPDVPVYGDIRTITVDDGWLVSNRYQRHEPTQENILPRGKIIRADSVDAICGGFPCQDISVAGKGAGIEGERSGLWSEYRRLIGELRPKIVIVENVAALLGRGLSTVLGDLAALGYDAEWHCIPAAAVGAPHRRDRVWIVAYHDEPGLSFGELFKGIQGNAQRGFEGQDIAMGGWWLAEPDVGRVAHGVPARVDRLRALGNAIVPQIAEVIGHAIEYREHTT